MEACPASRTIIELLDREFSSLLESLRWLTRTVPDHLLYKKVRSLTVGENILKSAGVLEQTFGGITANLWDDPFEWTLPETLQTPELVLKYIGEVDSAKELAVGSFVDDATLLKLIALPSGDSCSLLELLIKTLMRASEYRGQAAAAFKLLSDVSAPGFII
jgi:hypothetical protein